jgi:hypothetical protein
MHSFCPPQSMSAMTRHAPGCPSLATTKKPGIQDCRTLTWSPTTDTQFQDLVHKVSSHHLLLLVHVSSRLQALGWRRGEIHLAVITKSVPMHLWKLPPQKLQLRRIRSLQVAVAATDIQPPNPFLNQKLQMGIASSSKLKMLHVLAVPGSIRCQIRCNRGGGR